jgi:biotin carboxylase
VAGRQRLALVYDPLRFSVLALAEAARGVCDLTWVIDTALPESDSTLRQLRRFGTVVDVGGMSLEEAAASIAAERPDGILALSDRSLVWMAEVAQLLGLRSVTAEVARRLTDKDAQRSALKDGGVSVPGFWPIPDADDEDGWALLAREATFPAVLKPRRGEGGREVVAVRSFDHLRSLVADPLPGSQPTQLMLEEYLRDRPRDEGQEFAGFVSVESIVSAGRVSHLAITGRFPLAEPFRETGSFIPSALEDDERDAVLNAASAAIAALGITIGCQHTEIKLTPEGPRVIEVNGRVGAGVPDMLAAVTDLDVLAIALRIALGEAIVFDELPACAQVVFVLLRQAPVSMLRITAVEGLDQLRADPSVRRVILQRGPGQSVDWREGFWGHVFSVEGVVADHEQLRILARRIDSEIQIRGE